MNMLKIIKTTFANIQLLVVSLVRPTYLKLKYKLIRIMSFINEVKCYILNIEWTEGQVLANLIAFITFIYTIGKDIICWVLEKFDGYISRPRFDYDWERLNIILTLPLEYKNEFKISEPPKLRFVNGYKIFNRILFKKEIDNRDFKFEKRYNTLNTYTKLHLFKYNLTTINFYNLEFKQTPYLIVEFKLENTSITKTYSTKDLIKRGYKNEYNEFKIKFLEKQNRLLTYKSTFTLTEQEQFTGFKINPELLQREPDEK